MGVVLERCAALPAELQPATTAKAQDVFLAVRAEADVVEVCERLLAENSSNSSKIDATLQKAASHGLKHHSVQEVSQ